MIVKCRAQFTTVKVTVFIWWCIICKIGPLKINIFNGKRSRIFVLITLIFALSYFPLCSVLTSFYNSEDESNLLLPKLPTLPKKYVPVFNLIQINLTGFFLLTLTVFSCALKKCISIESFLPYSFFFSSYSNTSKIFR